MTLKNSIKSTKGPPLGSQKSASYFNDILKVMALNAVLVHMSDKYGIDSVFETKFCSEIMKTYVSDAFQKGSVKYRYLRIYSSNLKLSMRKKHTGYVAGSIHIVFVHLTFSGQAFTNKSVGIKHASIIQVQQETVPPIARNNENHVVFC